MSLEIIEEIAAQIKSQIGDKKPKFVMILGSGLGDIANDMKDPVVIPYEKIEGFPQSTVAGHQGKLIVGTLGSSEVICMQGRVHLYEGHSPREIDKIIKAFQILGAKFLIVTNAAGSLNIDMPAGSIMLIKDHINMSGQNPLIGPNNDKYGVRFPDMSDAYSKSFRRRVKKIAFEKGIELHEGVYVMVTGPNFETPAEIRAFKILGGDAVGMSTVPEVISAVHSGMRVLGFSIITNLGTGLQKHRQRHEETLAQGREGAQKLAILLKSL